jgi:hypothetical protein
MSSSSSRILRNSLPVFVALATAGLPLAAKADYIYALDLLTGNQLFEINTVTKTTTPIFNTGIGFTNSFSYDSIRRQFWVRNNQVVALQPSGGLAVTSISVTGTTPTLSGNNAAYYNNSIWNINNTNLQQTLITYNSSNTPVSGVSSIAPIVGYSANNGQFGDIAINSSGILYAATNTGAFFSVNTADPSASYNLIKSGGNPSLQLSFSADFNTLYGQSTSSNSSVPGDWYTVDLTTGNLTPISGFSSTPSFGDLGGASRDSIFTVPGPLPLVGGAVGLAWSRRLRKRIKLAGKTTT